MKKVQFVVPRSSMDEMTVAVVTAEVKDYSLVQDSSFLSALTKGVTAWVKGSESGKQEWSSSSEDLNVGDLSHCTKDPDLIRELKKVGITNLEIETFVDHSRNSNWTYDTVLARMED